LRWAAPQPGRSNPELKLLIRVLCFREEDMDLSFLDFRVTRRHRE